MILATDDSGTVDIDYEQIGNHGWYRFNVDAHRPSISNLLYSVRMSQNVANGSNDAWLFIAKDAAGLYYVVLYYLNDGPIGFADGKTIYPAQLADLINPIEPSLDLSVAQSCAQSVATAWGYRYTLRWERHQGAEWLDHIAEFERKTFEVENG